MNSLVVTVDLDWACEAAIEETLNFLEGKNIHPTVFITHRSPLVEACMDKMEIGLHPYFDVHSSHGPTIAETVRHVMDLPHNFPAFRCHRFGICNISRRALAEAGMQISSNVCTDLEVIQPFRDRFGLLEMPVFLEDGGYLWRKHPLEINPQLVTNFSKPGPKVVIIHPMHFSLNTPHFNYMYDIKQSLGREEWKSLTKKALGRLEWKKRGIRDLIIDLLDHSSSFSSLGNLAAAS